MGVLLQVGVVGAGRGGEEVPLSAGPPGCIDHVRVDEDAAQALHAKTLDEAHPAHIGGEVVYLYRALDGADGVLLLAQVHGEAFHAGHALVPFRQRLAVDGADARVAKVVEVTSQRACDKPAGAPDDDQVVEMGLSLDGNSRFRHGSYR